MAIATFKDALALTLRFEGGYADHAADPGGATKFGITRAVLAEWRCQSVTRADVAALRRTEAEAIYRRRYWEMVGADDLPAGIDAAVFDLAVNSGVDRASRLLQKVVGVTADGIIGVDTIRVVRAVDPTAVIVALNRRRRGFLAGLRIFPVFRRGWLRRIAAVESFALERAGGIARRTPFLSPQQEFQPMDVTKSILESRTVWANIVGLSALAAKAFGFDVAALDQPALVDTLLTLVSAMSFVASSVFRVRATRLIA